MPSQQHYIAFIVNPSAGDGEDSATIRGIKDYLRSRSHHVVNQSTAAAGHANELADIAACDEKCSLVIVAGGDGTVREVIEGMAGSDKPLMIIPCGTENLLANELGMHNNLDLLKSVFDEAHTCRLDLGSVNDRTFTSVVGVGFDGEIVHRVSEKRTGHIRHKDYFGPIWHTFWHHKFPSLDVVIDGSEIFSGRGFVVVGNISRYCIGLGVHRYADPGDGLLDVVIYKCRSWPRMLKHSVNTFIGRHPACGDVIYKQGKHIQISGPDTSVCTEIDGDPGPDLPLDIKIIPRAVCVLVPKNRKPAGLITRFFRALA